MSDQGYKISKKDCTDLAMAASRKLLQKYQMQMDQGD